LKVLLLPGKRKKEKKAFNENSEPGTASSVRGTDKGQLMLSKHAGKMYQKADCVFKPALYSTCKGLYWHQHFPWSYL